MSCCLLDFGGGLLEAILALRNVVIEFESMDATSCFLVAFYNNKSRLCYIYLGIKGNQSQ